MSKKTDREALGTRLKDAREYRGYSQDEVAKYLGVSRSAISLVETGERGLDVLELKKLTSLFQCTVEELTGEGPPAGPDVDSIKMVARAAADLTPEDRDEVLRFAQFLRARKPRDGK